MRVQLQAQAQNPTCTVACAPPARSRSWRQGFATGGIAVAERRTRATGGTARCRRRGRAHAVPMPRRPTSPMMHQVAKQVRRSREQHGAARHLDAAPGDMIEGRYKYIERIGKGAFGTVLLMEDTVVDDRLILKFLNPNVSEDEEMMKRFVHELRYSRKITHQNVIRIYDFL
jgi:hypothetical protein